MEKSSAETNSTKDEGHHPLVSSIRARLCKLPPLSKEICIYRVPERLRRINEKAYTPEVISIGPFHHGKPGLEAMEEAKFRYLETFLNWSDMSLEDLVGYIEDSQEKARNCYAFEIDFDRNEFMEIILVDAAFLVVLLQKHFFDDYDGVLLRGALDKSEIDHDLVLLENQLPLFILKDLFTVTRIPASRDGFTNLTIEELVCDFFSDITINKNIYKNSVIYDAKHFVDLLRVGHFPSNPRSLPGQASNFDFPPTLTELHEAGVKIVLSPNENYADMKFANGILQIPHIVIQDKTEVVLRNFVAFEHCHHQDYRHITDYVAIMDSLVNTPKDVELLCQSGILGNELGDNLAASDLFNNLGKEIIYNYETFYYRVLCEDLNAYCKVSWHKWQAELKHVYFKNPWTIISVIAAVILLLLTLMQTIASIISVVP